jgi:hypothetical protein
LKKARRNLRKKKTRSSLVPTLKRKRPKRPREVMTTAVEATVVDVAAAGPAEVAAVATSALVLQQAVTEDRNVMKMTMSM